jgi:hypothetical protein
MLPGGMTCEGYAVCMSLLPVLPDEQFIHQSLLRGNRI